MKFNIQKEDFSEGLDRILPIIASRPKREILKTVLLQAKADNTLHLISTNLDIGIQVSVKAKVETPGSLALPAHKISQIVRSLPGNKVQIEVLEANNCKVTCGGSTFWILGQVAEEFPTLPRFDKSDECKVQCNEFGQMLKNVAYASSRDETRPRLNGVLFILKRVLSI